MANSRFEKQLEFLIEADKMKNIFRQNNIYDNTRAENDAEHSWHIALFAIVLHEHADTKSSPVDLSRVVKMCVIHDLVEVYAGDTYAYDEKGNESKLERERSAADKLFGMLPTEQNEEMRQLWEEFDAMETPDAQFASALDRFQSFVANCQTDGHVWKTHGVSRDQIYKRIEIVKISAPGLWGFVEEKIADAIEKGWLSE